MLRFMRYLLRQHGSVCESACRGRRYWRFSDKAFLRGVSILGYLESQYWCADKNFLGGIRDYHCFEIIEKEGTGDERG